MSRRIVHISLCRRALARWQGYCRSAVDLSYVESVAGTRQQVDPQLPDDAFETVLREAPGEEISQRYMEPITALQDDDLILPDDIEFAYYAIYNLYRKYARNQPVDDWLIVNQALASLGPDAPVREILVRVIDHAESAAAAGGPL